MTSKEEPTDNRGKPARYGKPLHSDLTPECKQAQFAGIPWFQPRECQVDDTTERYTVRCDCGGSMPGRHVPIDPSFQTRVTCLHSAVEKWNRRG